MRLASLSPGTTEILYALGKGHELVCVDQFSDEPGAVRDLPHLRGHQDVDVVELSDHQPELIFTATLVQEKLAQQLREQDYDVVHQDPRTWEQVCASVREIGMLLQCEDEAHALERHLREQMNTVKKRARMLPVKLRVYIEEWHNPPMASGNWLPDLVRIAGGDPFPIGSGAPSREVTLDEVTAFDPELIVLSICGAGSLAQKELLTGRAGWCDLPAVQQGNVRVIDDSLLNRPGPRLVEGVQRLYGWMFEQLH